MTLLDRRAIRRDWYLFAIGSIIVVVLPVPIFTFAPAAWCRCGLLASDILGFGLITAVCLRCFLRMRRARRLALRLETESNEQRRRLDRVLVDLATRRRRGPLS